MPSRVSMPAHKSKLFRFLWPCVGPSPDCVSCGQLSCGRHCVFVSRNICLIVSGFHSCVLWCFCVVFCVLLSSLCLNCLSVLRHFWLGDLAFKCCPRNDLLCVGWDVKCYSLTRSFQNYLNYIRGIYILSYSYSRYHIKLCSSSDLV